MIDSGAAAPQLIPLPLACRLLRPYGESMESTKDVNQQQVAWARSRGLFPDVKGYLPALSDNLFRGALSAGAAKSFTAGAGGELTDTAASGKRRFRPAKMRALHSSAALAVNVFDHWMEPPHAALFAALGYPTGTFHL